MKLNLIKLGSFLLAAIAITSCSTGSSQEDLSFNGKYLIMPSGAPTLGTYKLITEGKVDVLTDATNIPAQLSKGDYPFVVFDSTKAVTLLKNQGEDAKYSFVKMITGGNFHLFAFNKTEEEAANLTITSEDNVYGFQENNTPDMLFKTIYKDAGGCDVYLDSISSLRDTLLTMTADYKINGEVVDYAVVAEPAATAIKTNLTKKGIKLVDINLQTELKKVTTWDKDYIPQAGLFVRNDVSKDSDLYKTVLSEINSSISLALSKPGDVKNALLSAYDNDDSKVTSNFGFSSSVLEGVQGSDGSKNGFGIVPNDVTFTVEEITFFNGLLAK